MRWTAYRAAFMADDALRQHPDISWIFAARKCAAARLGAYRAAFRKRCGRRALRDRDWSMPERPAHAGSEIVLHQTEDGQSRIAVRLEGDAVWLTQVRDAHDD